MRFLGKYCMAIVQRVMCPNGQRVQRFVFNDSIAMSAPIGSLPKPTDSPADSHHLDKREEVTRPTTPARTRSSKHRLFQHPQGVSVEKVPSALWFLRYFPLCVCLVLW
jgi:hypothetical protein